VESKAKEASNLEGGVQVESIVKMNRRHCIQRVELLLGKKNEGSKGFLPFPRDIRKTAPEKSWGVQGKNHPH